MKLSEIFRKTVARENTSTDSKTDAPKSETAQERPDLLNATGERELSDEKIAIGENESLETPPFQPPRVALPEGYSYPDATAATQLHAELLRELTADHPLFGVPLETFAACDANDDTLFRFRGNPGRFVLVHLTWLGRTEIDKDHPSIVLDGTFADFPAYGTEVYRIISEQ